MPTRKPINESDKALAAYAHYENLGEERSLIKVREEYQRRAKLVPEGGKKPYVPGLNTLKTWSSTWGWQVRIKAYEEMQLAIRRKRRQKEIDKMDEEHALIARTNLIKIQDYLADMVKSGQMSDSAAVSWFDKLAKLERTARGAATERSEVTGRDGEPLIPGHDDLLEALSDEEFEQLKQLREKAMARYVKDN